MRVIKSSEEISHLFKEGRKFGTPDVNFIVAKSMEQHDQDGRVAFIAGKKLGNAVWRNRAKRRMRGLCKELGGPFPGYDVIFLARKSLNDAPFAQVKKNARSALEKQGIL